MSLTLKEVALPEGWMAKWGRKDAWHGDTHTADGKLVEEAKAMPRIMMTNWFPAAVGPDDLVSELHITYTDGQVVRVPAEEFRVST